MSPNPSELARIEDEGLPDLEAPALPTVQAMDFADITPDPKNANKGTRRGRALLDKSLEKLGAGRSILLDKNNVAIAGNKTLEAAAEKGLPVMVVETDGEVLIAVKRRDLDMASSTDTRARELALADNRIGQVDLDWDTDVLREMKEDGVPVDEWGLDKEIEKDDRGSKGVGELDRAVQLKPEREYVVIMVDPDDDGLEWERLKVALNLQPVRRGGYKAGSQFDAVGTQRVVRARDLLALLPQGGPNGDAESAGS